MADDRLIPIIGASVHKGIVSHYVQVQGLTTAYTANHHKRIFHSFWTNFHFWRKRLTDGLQSPVHRLFKLSSVLISLKKLTLQHN